MKLTTLHQNIGEVLPSNGEVGGFVVSLALYFQDLLAAFHAAKRGDGPNTWEYAYFSRLQWGHLYESLLSVKRCESQPDVAAFLKRLPLEPRNQLAAAKKVYERNQDVLSRLRNQTFHYPSPTGDQAEGWAEIKALLAGLAADPIQMPEGHVMDVKYPWAEEIAVRRIFEAAGGPEGFKQLASEMGGAVQDHNRFVMAVLDLALRDGHDRYLQRSSG